MSPVKLKIYLFMPDTIALFEFIDFIHIIFPFNQLNKLRPICIESLFLNTLIYENLFWLYQKFSKNLFQDQKDPQLNISWLVPFKD